MSQLAFGLDQVSLQERFMRFHARHPEVYAALVRKSRAMREAGLRRLAIARVIEELRYERVPGLPDAREAFKLNNDYRSRYARLIMEREPDLAGAFELRELKAV